MRAPEGGPADDEPPFVESSFPDSGAVGLGALDSLRLVFSERMDKRSVETSFRITPEVRYREKIWLGTTWTLYLAAPLDSSTTYVALLSREARDRRGNHLPRPWPLPFSTGEALDDGRVSGKVVGARFRPDGLYVYAWPWEDGPPDTTTAGFPPDPIRVGQTEKDGRFVVEFLPRERPLRLCAFYDRDGDGQFQPLPDRWACLPDSIVLADTSGAVPDLEIFLTEAEEPGTLAGTVVDSLCLRWDARAALREVRAERDSLLEWLEGELDARVRGRPTITPADSVRIEAELADLVLREEAASSDSALCARPIRVEVRTGGDSLVAEGAGPDFRFTELDPGVYRLSAYRDVDGTGAPGEGEARGSFPFAVELKPLRTIDDLTIQIALPDGEPPLRPASPDGGSVPPEPGGAGSDGAVERGGTP